MRRVLTESGEWRDGAAAPQHLPDELRRLPGEIVTKDVDDPDKAHEIDAPHVVNTIAKDFVKAQVKEERDDTPQKVAKKLWAPGPGERAPVRQWFVDVARMRVIAALVNRAVDSVNQGVMPDLTPCHLWFETNNVNAYCLRMGNPPPPKERPKHLKNIDLVVDVMSPPQSIVDILKRKGVDFDPRAMLRKAEEGSRLVHLV